MKITTFIKKHGLKMRVLPLERRDDGLGEWGEGATHWDCMITHPKSGHPATIINFSQGSAHTKPPTLADVLDCLASDSAGVENARSFEEWCSEYGYDDDSRKAERIYQACQEQAEQLMLTLGDDAYKTLLWEVERE